MVGVFDGEQLAERINPINANVSEIILIIFLISPCSLKLANVALFSVG
jgi:hypothetical protein